MSSTAALMPANIAAYSEGLSIDTDEIRLYVALREAAHQRLFEHVPWLRGHVLATVEAYATGIRVAELAGLDEAAFRERFRRSPVKRAKRRGLLRNVSVALGNSRDASKRPLLERLSEDADPVVREHALWALRRLSAGPSAPAGSR